MSTHVTCDTTYACELNVASLIYHLLFWQAPLLVCSTKRRHQSPEWMDLTHVNCFIQGEVIGFQVLLGSLHPRSMRVSWWSSHMWTKLKIYWKKI